MIIYSNVARLTGQISAKPYENYFYSEISQVPGQRSAPSYDQACDNVLLGQGYRTPHGTVIDVYGCSKIIVPS
jgi:hypothetical protein